MSAAACTSPAAATTSPPQSTACARATSCSDLLSDANEAAAVSLLDRAALFADVVMPGYTHLQPAQPITFGFYLSGIASALARDAGRLVDAWKRLNLSPMGAAALATTSFPIDRALVADLLGFDAVLEHGLDCVASRDFALEIIASATAHRADAEPVRAGHARDGLATSSPLLSSRTPSAAPPRSCRRRRTRSCSST